MPTLATNKTAHYNYEILDEYEAGIVLTGPEVKSAKMGQVNLRGSYVSIRADGAWLVNCQISPYKPAHQHQTGYVPTRERRLLMRQDELRRFVGKSALPCLTVVPISLYTKGSLVKVKIAIGRGKRKVDKRETIKKREIDRRLRRVAER
jgi:SsrA-binding protein